MAFLSLFSTKSIAWNSWMWAWLCATPQRVGRDRQMTSMYLQTLFLCLAIASLRSSSLHWLVCECCCSEHLWLDTGSRTRKPLPWPSAELCLSTEGRPWAWAIRFSVLSWSSCYFSSCKIPLLLTGINLPKLGRIKRDVLGYIFVLDGDITSTYS